MTTMTDKELFGNSEQLDDTISRQAAINAIEFGITYATAINIETGEATELFQEGNDELKKAVKRVKGLPSAQRWIPCSERLPEYGVAVLTYDGSCYSVEKRIPTIRDDNGEPIPGEWWVSDDYDESNSVYYPNLRDGACIAWMPLPEPYEEGEK